MIVVVGKNLFLYLQGFFMAFVQQSVMRDLRDTLFDKYQRLSLDYFHKRRTGQLMSRVTNDTLVLNESIDIGFNRLVTDSVMVLTFLSFLIILSWKLTLLAMVMSKMSARTASPSGRVPGAAMSSRICLVRWVA